MPQFPSVEWFEQVREIFNGEEAYQEAGGGMCDATMGIKVASQSYILVFEGEECSEAREVAEPISWKRTSTSKWRPTNGKRCCAISRTTMARGLDHTLNTLDMDRSEGLAITMNGDQYRQDFFYRYNQTFQYFFDASARIDTEFALVRFPGGRIACQSSRQ